MIFINYCMATSLFDATAILAIDDDHEEVIINLQLSSLIVGEFICVNYNLFNR